MDNAYQQKLQERATTLAREYYGGIFDFFEDPRKQEAILGFKKIATLTLEWSAEAMVSGYHHGMHTTDRTKKGQQHLIMSYGFIPPKTDNNEG